MPLLGKRHKVICFMEVKLCIKLVYGCWLAKLMTVVVVMCIFSILTPFCTLLLYAGLGLHRWPFSFASCSLLDSVNREQKEGDGGTRKWGIPSFPVCFFFYHCHPRNSSLPWQLQWVSCAAGFSFQLCILSLLRDTSFSWGSGWAFLQSSESQIQRTPLCKFLKLGSLLSSEMVLSQP